MKKVMFLILSFLSITVNVYAGSCPSEEKVKIGKESLNLKVTKEEKEAEIDRSLYKKPDDFDVSEENYTAYYNYFDITFYNISQNFYVIVTNTETKEKTKIKYEDTNNGTYVIKHNNLDKPTTYKYSVFGSEYTNCNGTSIKDGMITIPALNPYYTHVKCQDKKDYYLCQKYINSEISYKSFEEKMTEYEKKQEVQEEQKKKEQKKSYLETIKEFVLKYKYLIGGAALTIIVAIVVISVIVRKKRVI